MDRRTFLKTSGAVGAGAALAGATARYPGPTLTPWIEGDALPCFPKAPAP
jgi:TAT (twin-arginine translocation) pathway signal sequence